MGTANIQFELSSLYKEEVDHIQFVSEDVLVSEDQKSIRQKQLAKALNLGHMEKSKSKIVFATNEGLKKLESMVFGMDDHEVLLKAGIYIPIHSICHVAVL
ncbi:MAG: hypothetical protein ACHQK8_06970, partial [Bacteroidia bacterium]